MAPGTKLPDMEPGTEPDTGLPATGSEFQTAPPSINRKRQSNLTPKAAAERSEVQPRRGDAVFSCYVAAPATTEILL